MYSAPMSLLECICCSRHRLRAAVVWEDPLHDVPCFFTYSDILRTADQIARTLSGAISSDAPVAIFGKGCPEILTAILAVLSLTFGDGGGVAFLPVSLNEVGGEQERLLSRCGVELVLVEISLLEEFLSNCEKWVELRLVSMDTSLLSYGLIIACVSHTGGARSKYTVSKLEGLDSTTLCKYRGDCEMSCYACRLLPQDMKTLDDVCPVTNGCPVNCVCPDSGCPVSCVRPDSGCPVSCVRPDSIAYMLTTSGTTGVPKLVQVPHCSIVPNIVDLRSRFNITPDDVVFNAAPLTFDPSFVEIFLALSTGSQLLLVPDEVKSSPSSLAAALLHKHCVSVLQVTPTLLYRFDEGVVREILGDCSHVRVLAFGGEVCPRLEWLSERKSSENTTELYNIYGITEVSSWATCHKLTPLSSPLLGQGEEPVVPLGHPLLGTKVEVRDSKTGSVLQEDQEGLIWLGGGYRVCLVAGETRWPEDGMRCSGDRGFVNRAGHLVYTGREDHQVKRWGHRVNLNVIQQKITSKLDEISSCVLHHDTIATNSSLQVPHPQTKLRCFVTPHPPPLPASEREGLPDAPRTSVLLGKMRTFLPSHCIPEELVWVKSLPMTAHGKVDIKSLINVTRKELFFVGEDRNHTPLSRPCTPSLESITSLLVSTVTSLSGLGACPVDTRLTYLGVNSFDVIRIANQINTELQARFGSHDGHMTMLAEKLLESKVCDVAEYIVGELSESSQGSDSALRSHVHAAPVHVSLEGSHAGHVTEEGVVVGEDNGASKGRKRYSVLNSSLSPTRKSARMESSCEDHVTSQVITVESWRRGQYFINGNLQPVVAEGAASQQECEQVRCELRTIWKVDTHKCVDASPLLVRKTPKQYNLTTQLTDSSSRNQTLDHVSKTPSSYSRDTSTSSALATETPEVVVYVGSHSCLFLALEFASGRVLWRRALGGRVESSACSSKCGGFVVVGCYDGVLYTLVAGTGEIHWQFQPSDSDQPIKSSPCADPHTGYVWFGSHDHHLYAVDVYNKHMLHRLYPGGGSIFSTPCIDAEHRVIYCATLRGLVAAFNMESGCMLWRYSAGDKPVFSSLCLISSEEKVVFGGVGGQVYLLSARDGREVHKVNTESCVFSSCSILQTEGSQSHTGTKIFCGSHSNCLYCWNGNLELQWRMELDSEVYSIPSYFPVRFPNACQHTLQCVSVCSSNGVLYLVNASSGCVVSKLHLPDKVFSSPVCFEDCVIVGCRDDYIYCVQALLK